MEKTKGLRLFFLAMVFLGFTKSLYATRGRGVSSGDGAPSSHVAQQRHARRPAWLRVMVKRQVEIALMLTVVELAALYYFFPGVLDIFSLTGCRRAWVVVQQVAGELGMSVYSLLWQVLVQPSQTLLRKLLAFSDCFKMCPVLPENLPEGYTLLVQRLLG